MGFSSKVGMIFLYFSILKPKTLKCSQLPFKWCKWLHIYTTIYYYYFRGPSSGQCHDFGGRQNSLTARSGGPRAVNEYWQPATLGNHLTSNVGRDRRQLIRWYHSMQWILHWRQMPTNQLTSLEAEFDVNAPCIRPHQVDFLISRKRKNIQCAMHKSRRRIP